MLEDEISIDEKTLIPLRKDRHTVSIDETKDTMVVIITPLSMYGKDAEMDDGSEEGL